VTAAVIALGVAVCWPFAGFAFSLIHGIRDELRQMVARRRLA
jgi:hypothetical protein